MIDIFIKEPKVTSHVKRLCVHAVWIYYFLRDESGVDMNETGGMVEDVVMLL